jgi:thiamine-monophosphate kinase
MKVMNKLNEKEIIKIFQKKLGNSKFVSEDVEVFKLGKSNCVSKVDTLVESTDIPPGMNLKDAIRKSVVASVSDFASKGVKPLFGMVSLTIPKSFPKLKIKELAHGLGEAAKEFKIKIIGGDTNEGKELVVQVTLFGTAKKIIRRSGANLEDIIVTTGPFGYTAAGLKIIKNGDKTNSKFLKKAKNSVFRPNPRLNFGIIGGKFFSSSMDSSDGLSTSLHEMSRQSKKQFVITRLPAQKDLFDFAKKNRIDPINLIFNGGEEYEIIFTVNPENFSKVKKTAKLQKIPLFEIGFVKSGVGVMYKTGTKTIRIKNKGWLHFGS